jgi:hypothetical protein
MTEELWSQNYLTLFFQVADQLIWQSMSGYKTEKP